MRGERASYVRTDTVSLGDRKATTGAFRVYKLQDLYGTDISNMFVYGKTIKEKLIS